jgi:hypothetical protein
MESITTDLSFGGVEADIEFRRYASTKTGDFENAYGPCPPPDSVNKGGGNLVFEAARELPCCLCSSEMSGCTGGSSHWAQTSFRLEIHANRGSSPRQHGGRQQPCSRGFFSPPGDHEGLDRDPTALSIAPKQAPLVAVFNKAVLTPSLLLLPVQTLKRLFGSRAAAVDLMSLFKRASTISALRGGLVQGQGAHAAWAQPSRWKTV